MARSKLTQVAFASFFCSLLSLAQASAAEVKGVRLPESAVVDGRTLTLNGIGLRQKTVFNVDIFVAGLYLETPSRDETAIRKSSELKKIVVVFMRDGTAQQIQDSWNEGFEKNCKIHCEQLTARLRHLNSLMTDVHKGQEVRLTFYPDHLTIGGNGRAENIEGADFADMVLATFIGEQPPTAELKAELLKGGATALSQR